MWDLSSRDAHSDVCQPSEVISGTSQEGLTWFLKETWIRSAVWTNYQSQINTKGSWWIHFAGINWFQYKIKGNHYWWNVASHCDLVVWENIFLKGFEGKICFCSAPCLPPYDVLAPPPPVWHALAHGIKCKNICFSNGAIRNVNILPKWNGRFYLMRQAVTWHTLEFDLYVSWSFCCETFCGISSLSRSWRTSWWEEVDNCRWTHKGIIRDDWEWNRAIQNMLGECKCQKNVREQNKVCSMFITDVQHLCLMHCPSCISDFTVS